MALTTNQKGNIAETKVIFEASKLGYLVSKPIVDCPYDIVLDDTQSKRLLRVQVKHVSPKNGVLSINFYREQRDKSHAAYNAGNIDMLALYDAVTEEVYFVPVSEIDGKTSITLRLTETKNGQTAGVKFAKDYKELNMKTENKSLGDHLNRIMEIDSWLSKNFLAMTSGGQSLFDVRRMALAQKVGEMIREKIECKEAIREGLQRMGVDI